MLVLKLLAVHGIMTLVQFLLMPVFFGILTENDIYQWTVGLLYIALFWLMIYVDVSYTGSQHDKQGTYLKQNGFVAGLLASLPAILIYFAGVIYFFQTNEFNWFFTALRIWLVPYTKVIVTFEQNIMIVLPVIILIFPLVTGISYLDGPRKRKKLLDIIAKSEASRIAKSKVSPK